MSNQTARQISASVKREDFSYLPADFDAVEYLNIDTEPGIRDMIFNAPDIATSHPDFTFHPVEDFKIYQEVHMKIHFTTVNIEKRKEHFYIHGIKNLLKRSNYLNLCLKLEQEVLNEDEFDDEIEANPEDYIIKMEKPKSDADIAIIDSIIRHLGKDFSVGDAEDIFGISLD